MHISYVYNENRSKLINFEQIQPRKKQIFEIIFYNTKIKQETPQCDETRFSTLQPSIDMTGIRNERWQ